MSLKMVHMRMGSISKYQARSALQNAKMLPCQLNTLQNWFEDAADFGKDVINQLLCTTTLHCCSAAWMPFAEVVMSWLTAGRAATMETPQST